MEQCTATGRHGPKKSRIKMRARKLTWLVTIIVKQPVPKNLLSTHLTPGAERNKLWALLRKPWRRAWRAFLWSHNSSSPVLVGRNQGRDHHPHKGYYRSSADAFTRIVDGKLDLNVLVCFENPCSNKYEQTSSFPKGVWWNDG
jgi:hypothetical protein